MIARDITPKIEELKEKYPVIAITGPRQSGKTTLAKAIFPSYEYYNLENIDLFIAAQNDPKSFLQIGTRKRIIIDEAQKLPELLSYIQTEVDNNKIQGQFVITGSQQFSLNENISQTLAGRVANFTLLPFSVSELSKTKYNDYSHLDFMYTGFYPAIYEKEITPKDYYRDYLSTYVERDVRQIKNIGDLSRFRRFLMLIAGRVGQIVNLTSLANDSGVTHKTIESWLSVLEASFILFRFQPYYENFGKRLIKSPKIYFYDTGLLCYLLGLDSVRELNSHFAVGNIFENFIISEKLKENFNKRLSDKLYFWRDNAGNEVDLIIDSGGIRKSVEIKIGQTFSTSMLKGIDYWKSLNHKVQTEGEAVYTGNIEQKVRDIKITNWRNFVS